MSEPKYLLDECIYLPRESREAIQAIHATQIVKMGTTDIDLRQEAMKRGLVIITKDKEFVLHSMRLNVPIIWRYRGLWYLAKGSFEILDDPFDKIGKYCRVNDCITIP